MYIIGMKAVKNEQVRVNVIEKKFPIFETLAPVAAVNARLSRMKNVISVDG